MTILTRNNWNGKMTRIESLLTLLILFALVSGCAQISVWKTKNDIPVTDELTAEQLEELDLQFGLTRIVERKGQLDEAKKSYQMILEIDPSYSKATHRLGVIAAQREDIDLAIELLLSAEKITPNSANLLADLGYVLLLDRQLTAAEEYLSRAFELNSEDPRITNNLALAFGYQGETERALDLFRRCNPESQSLTNIGYVHSQLGELERARHYFHAALDIDPKIQQAAAGLVEVEKLSRLDKQHSRNEALTAPTLNVAKTSE